MNVRALQKLVPALDAHVERAVTELHAKGWVVLREFSTVEFARGLRQEGTALLGRGNFRRAGIGRGADRRVESAVRGDSVHWMDPARATEWEACWLQIADRLRLRLNERLLLGLFDYEAHLALYPPHSGYARHRDLFTGSTERVLTTTFYLNEDWRDDDGGALRLYLDAGDHVDVLPRAGTLVLFLSRDFEHEVLPARRERWSVTGWFRRRA